MIEMGDDGLDGLALLSNSEKLLEKEKLLLCTLWCVKFVSTSSLLTCDKFSVQTWDSYQDTFLSVFKTLNPFSQQQIVSLTLSFKGKLEILPEQLLFIFVHIGWRDIGHNHLHVKLVHN